MLMKVAPRIILYGRHSTALQNASSSEDQVASCQKLVDFHGGTVVETYLDPEESGYKRDRSGLNGLLRHIETGEVDLVICEALDRLARDAEDVAFLGKKLGYHGVQLHTVTEGHVDEIKFAVAGLLGAIFLKNLIDKTLRGMEAAVLAHRFAGGRAFGFKPKKIYDEKGERIRGYLDIEETEAEVITRIFRDFANGLSSIQIATALNQEGIPAPRGGAWNASTIRGDPKKLVGILNNPLYVGRLVWGRRQWRRNPDSEKRERRYRLRDQSEWIEVEVPDLRIVDDELWEAVRQEIERRQRQPDAKAPAGKPRKKHLLSGLIKCSICGSNYTISGKDYYRCAGQKERGTCGNNASIRKSALENASLAVLQHHLFTEDHARIFVETFNREVAKTDGQRVNQDRAVRDRLILVERELENLAANMLTGVLSPTLIRLLGERETEKTELKARLARTARGRHTAEIVPHPALLQMFAEKIGALCETLNNEVIRTEAAELIGRLIESVTIYPDGANGPEAEVVSKVEDLVSFALNDNAAPKGGVASSMTVVAGGRSNRAQHQLLTNI